MAQEQVVRSTALPLPFVRSWYVAVSTEGFGAAGRPRIPTYKRRIDPLEAPEELVGFEALKGPEESKYWFPQFGGGGERDGSG